MFDVESDVDLLEVMGEATRDESTSIALRLLAVGELYARRAVELVERNLWSTDPTDWVAAEVSAAQNVSHARAVGQITYGRTLRERLPAVANAVANVASFEYCTIIRLHANDCISAKCPPSERQTAKTRTARPIAEITRTR